MRFSKRDTFLVAERTEVDGRLQDFAIFITAAELAPRLLDAFLEQDPCPLVSLKIVGCEQMTDSEANSSLSQQDRVRALRSNRGAEGHPTCRWLRQLSICHEHLESLEAKIIYEGTFEGSDIGDHRHLILPPDETWVDDPKQNQSESAKGTQQAEQDCIADYGVNYERDKWLVEQRPKLQNAELMRQLQNQIDAGKHWAMLESDRGILDAIKNFCAKCEVQQPKAPRGRPKKKSVKSAK